MGGLSIGCEVFILIGMLDAHNGSLAGSVLLIENNFRLARLNKADAVADSWMGMDLATDMAT